jgi:UDP-2,3-diacylglucosamine pyrophosphatase LpxH
LTASDGHDVQQTEPAPYRTVFISDVHLGAKTCQAERLVAFLRDLEADAIYLVGDIVDGWPLKTGWYWPQPHNDVVQKLLRKARKGTRLVYVPGNHDEFLRNYFGTHFGGIEVVADAVHVAADGKRYLVTHGDRFDIVVKHARWLSLFGDQASVLAITINKLTNWFRRRFGLGYWSLSGYIHHPASRDIGGVRYVNCGDWIESCTVAVENRNGEIEILWTAPAEHLAPVPQRARAA